MSRIFLSHASEDLQEALALQDWLSEQEPQLANEIFLDADPVAGLRPGVRWKRELFQQNSRCEAVICLLSPNWEASHECKTEYRTAESLGKQILCARLRDIGDTDITSEWQRCDLFGGEVTTPIAVPGGSVVEFNTVGLTQLRDAIRGAGIGPENFVWPPKNHPDRPPYRGWEPFDDIDAGVFFGRDAAVVRGLDELRNMRNDGLKSLFVVLGPSGSGKSSFLRAGLLPRLQKDDRHFLTLGIMRPQRAALTGTTGLAAAIDSARRALKLRGAPLGEVKKACTSDTGRLVDLLIELRTAATARLSAAGQDGAPPTLVLPLDQAEELFVADAGPEADQFLTLMVELFDELNSAEVALLISATIRTDRFEVMQNHPALAGVNTVLFDELKPMPPTQFKEVIEGPAARTADSDEPIHLSPDLVDRLLADATRGADTLPLLSLTLARLYADYGTEGELTVANYEAMGEMVDIVNTEINEVLSGEPEERRRQLAVLRSAFIPWLATISSNNEPMRKVARYTDLPVDSQPLIEALVDKRLMVKDTRGGQVMVEVALESLLRQWDQLAVWLGEERQNLKTADDIDRNTIAWTTSGNDPAWLVTGTRLADAETIAALGSFGERLAASRDYLDASRQAETHRLRMEEERRDAELRAANEHADSLRRRSRVLQVVLTVTAIIAVVAVVASVLALRATKLADENAEDTTIFRGVSDAQFMLADERQGGDTRAIQQLLAANSQRPGDAVNNAMLHALIDRRRLTTVSDTGGDVVAVSVTGRGLVPGSPKDAIQVFDARTGRPVAAAISDPDGHKVATMSRDGGRVTSVSSNDSLNTWDVDSGQPSGPTISAKDAGYVSVIALSPNGRLIATADSTEPQLGLWDVETGRPATGNAVAAKMPGPATSLAFDQDGKVLATGFEEGSVQLWDTSTGAPVGSPFKAHSAEVTSIAFSGDGSRIAIGSVDQTVAVFDTRTRKAIGTPLQHLDWVRSVAMNQDGTAVVSGSDDRTALLWYPDDGSFFRLIGDHDSVTGVAFSPDGQQIFSGSSDKSLRIWSAAETSLGTSAPTKHLQRNHEMMLAGLQLSALYTQNKLLLDAMAEKTGQPADTTPQPRLKDSNKTNSFVTSNTAFTADRKRLAITGQDGRIHVIDADTDRQVVKPLEGHEDWVFGLAFSHDGQELVSGGADDTVRLWNATTGEQIRQFASDNQQLVRSVAISPDKHRIVAGYEDGTLRRWDAVSGNPLGQLMTGHTRGVGAIAFSPDGSLIVSGSDDKALRMWDAATGQPVGDPMTGHSGAVYSVAFSSDGREMASGGYDKTVRVWDTASRQPLGSPLTGHAEPISGVDFSQDGSTMISEEFTPNDGGGVTRIWPGPTDWAKSLCAKLTANMTHQQWRDWISPDIGYVQTCADLPPPTDSPH